MQIYIYYYIKIYIYILYIQDFKRNDPFFYLLEQGSSSG